MSVKCPYCDKVFTDNDNLLKHFKRASTCGEQIKAAACTRRHFYDEDAMNVKNVVDGIGTNKILETLKSK